MYPFVAYPLPLNPFLFSTIILIQKVALLLVNINNVLAIKTSYHLDTCTPLIIHVQGVECVVDVFKPCHVIIFFCFSTFFFNLFWAERPPFFSIFFWVKDHSFFQSFFLAERPLFFSIFLLAETPLFFSKKPSQILQRNI